jgi:hypothetical protein
MWRQTFLLRCWTRSTDSHHGEDPCSQRIHYRVQRPGSLSIDRSEGTHNCQPCRHNQMVGQEWHPSNRSQPETDLVLDFVGLRWGWANSVRRPLSGLLYLPRDDRWVWSIWWKENWQGKPKYSEETCPNATLSIKNPTWLDLGSNPGSRDGKPATNSLSYGTASTRNWATAREPGYSLHRTSPSNYTRAPYLASNSCSSEHRLLPTAPSPDEQTRHEKVKVKLLLCLTN